MGNFENRSVVVSDIFSVLLVRHKMRQGVDGGMVCEKNDREMTGGLYGGVQGFWVRKDIIITTFATAHMLHPANIQKH